MKPSTLNLQDSDFTHHFNRTHTMIKTQPAHSSAAAAGVYTIATLVAASFLLLALLQPPEAAAAGAPPDRMTYQGYLVDQSGNPLAPTTPINYTIVFRIYDASEAGNLLWTEQQVVTVDKGNFSVVLGEGADFGSESRPALSTLFAHGSASDRYLQTTVTISGNPLTLLPRLRLLPSAYAFLATHATQLVNPSSGAPYISTAAGTVNITGTVNSTQGFTGLTAAQVPGLDATKIISGTLNTARIPNNLTGTRSFTGGLLGIGTTNPNDLLHVAGGNARFGNDVFWGTAAFLRNDQGGSIELGNSTTPGVIPYIDFHYGRPSPNNSFQDYNIRLINDLDGRLGLYGGYLSFGSGLADNKLALWDGGGNSRIGFGIQPQQFILHLNNAADRFAFRNGMHGGEIMTIRGHGYVGINNLNPRAPLEVSGGAAITANFVFYARSGNSPNTGFANTHTPTDYSIVAGGRVMASEFNAVSDARVKRVSGSSDGRADLTLIRQLRVKDYYAVDQVTEGAQLKKGFIAQEVKSLIPAAVTTGPGFIPNIYNVPQSSSYDAGAKQLTLSFAKPHDLAIGDTLRVYANNSTMDLPVAAVPSPERVVLGPCQTMPEEFFVFGKQVPDFHTLDYDRIFTLGVSAMQELDRLLLAQQRRIAELESLARDTESLRRDLTSLQQQLAARDTQNAQWEARFAALERALASRPPLPEEPPAEAARGLTARSIATNARPR